VIMNDRVMSAGTGVTGFGVVSLYNKGFFPKKKTAAGIETKKKSVSQLYSVGDATKNA